jgi:hypothetical protein
MSQIEQLAKEVAGLSPDDLAKFRRWFLDFDARAWDQEIEADSQAGKLDSLIAEARADYTEPDARAIRRSLGLRRGRTGWR